jgi:hypothetical protein
LLATAIVAVLTFAFAPRAMATACAAAVRTGWHTVLAAAIGFGVGIIPFALTYLPVAHQVGTLSYADVMMYAPQWVDTFNVGVGNLIWGHAPHLAGHGGAYDPYEVNYAITPLLVLTVLAGGLVLAWAGITRRVPMTTVRRATLALCATIVIFALLPVQTTIGSAWALVWHLPGASALRAIDRMQIVIDLVVALALVSLATEVDRRWRTRSRSRLMRIGGAVLLCLLVAEQAHDTSSTSMKRNVQEATLGQVPAPPPGCTSFFVADSRPNQTPFYVFQTTAMLISERVGLPTLNGYSGNMPPGWALSDPDAVGYAALVQSWAASHGLSGGLCRLDLGTMRWSHQPPG